MASKKNSSDGQRNVTPTSPVPSGLVRSKISIFEALIRAPASSAESSSGMKEQAGLIRASTPLAESSSGRNQQHPAPFAQQVRSKIPLAQFSSVRNHLRYQVFINHCGQDTKHTLSESIYKKLNANGLRVFLDKDEIDRGDFLGEVLENAIASASLHIAIFSKNYAKSISCLAELAFMLSFQPQVTFIPIFYDVDPFNLRWTVEEKGIYADAFNKHEKKSRYSTQKLQNWKSALRKASFYNGYIINNQCDEEVALRRVVNHVLKELKKVTLDIAKHAVGLNELEHDFDNMISLQSDVGPMQIVGIWGMGGAGKTTLAKHIYKHKCSLFKKSSFLFDVREAARKELLHEKQKELLKHLDKKNELLDVKNIDQGKEILRRWLKSVSVLIILDDVNHTNQLDALLPESEKLGHGSLIIVTTRDKSVLTAWGISTLYEIPTLNPSHAQQLFCWHAFGQPYPLEEFKELSQKFIDACHSLPLSLVVFGGQLYRQSSQTYWQSQLDKLCKIKPDDIKLRLKISYDSLNNEEKEMFLDVACFFIEWPCSEAIATWNGLGWNGMHGLQMLVNKCLVELDEKYFFELDEKEGDTIRIGMHDHLKDLGRDIALQQSPYRLWSTDNIIQIQPQQKAIGIRGMADAFGDNCYLQHGNIVLNTTQGMRILAPASVGLKIFSGIGDFINEECRELSKELVFFGCERFAHKSLPSWLTLKRLRVLELYAPQKLEDLWECDEDVSTFLTELRFFFSNAKYDNRIESWLQAPLELRLLKIQKGYGLNKISGLQRFRSLEELKIYDCTELNTLPSLALAISLKKFYLHGCNKLEKIESLEGLRSLEELKISDCTNLKILPNLAEATSLKKNDLYRCNKLEKIESLEGLRSLETLIISDCTELKILPSLSKATSLKEIDLRGCNKLEKIESLEGLRSLETLRIHDCRELHSLPSLAELISLNEIDLRECHKVEKVEGLEGLTSLKKLAVHMCAVRPCMLKLPEQSERLESVEVVANRLHI